jgi:hypothetical protein
VTKQDLAALRACIAIVERDPTRREQIRNMRPKLERALFACSVAQSEALNLKPWEVCPAESAPDPSDNANYAEQKRRARRLADQMRAAGLSIYEPDPLTALEQAAARARGDLPPPQMISEPSSGGRPENDCWGSDEADRGNDEACDGGLR